MTVEAKEVAQAEVVSEVEAVEEALNNVRFRTPDQNAFYVRNKHYADAVLSDSEFESPYEIVDLKVLENGVEGKIVKHIGSGIELPLELKFGDNCVRITVSEQSRRFNVEKWAFDNAEWTSPSSHDDDNVFKFGENELVVERKPIKFVVRRKGVDQIVINGRQLLNFEHRRAKEDTPKDHLGKHEIDTGAWEETFQDHTDIKVNGPESVAVDAEFVGYEHVYGIPEHSTSLSLPQFDEPYRLFNVDYPDYPVESPKALYGAIPLMQAHRTGSSAALFWANASDTYVDLAKSDSVHTHWISESGVLDFVVILGDEPKDITKSYGTLSGFAQLPQLFTLGYHQCRWNYWTQKEVETLIEDFEEYDIPVDVVWLDIEYTDGKQYFTWDRKAFPDPNAMCDFLAQKKRKLVTIIDPHVKADEKFELFAEMSKKNLAVLNKDGKPFRGHCWPGDSVWIDGFNEEAQKVWKEHHATFVEGADNVFIWNDMNEPSVFEGPEHTFDKSAIHHGEWEHRSVHNLYGQSFVKSTFNALSERYPDQRPFVLTRSFYAGSQRYGAAWTGDNTGSWSNLKASLPMVMTANLSGFMQIGPDTGGFFGEPSGELMARWFQLGTFYPFFRGHAYLECKPKEPWTRGEPYTSIIREAIKLRYKLLPTIYTAFYHGCTEGTPIMKPLMYSYPDNDKVRAMDDQFFLGDSGLLVKPVVEEGATHVDLYIPDEEQYFNYATGSALTGEGFHSVDAPLDTIPVFVRGGHIHARKDTPRPSAELMKDDPYTLVVAVSKDGTASGDLYIDDGISHNHKDGEYALGKFEYANGKLVGSVTGSDKFANLKIAAIELFGSDATSAVVEQAGKTTTVAIKDGKFAVDVSIGGDWTIELK
ncbi:glucosidase 2 subunit alpha [Trichomonascus vanleenenianus]|uniref:glycoside hydrolase family 31 protein n=1 Tax=Trichomonascus vanleenenianus TaxID=2268995 RepID=UPI003ECAF190